MGYSPRGRKESDMNERLNNNSNSTMTNTPTQVRGNDLIINKLLALMCNLFKENTYGPF